MQLVFDTVTRYKKRLSKAFPSTIIFPETIFRGPTLR